MTHEVYDQVRCKKHGSLKMQSIDFSTKVSWPLSLRRIRIIFVSYDFSRWHHQQLHSWADGIQPNGWRQLAQNPSELFRERIDIALHRVGLDEFDKGRDS